MTTLSQASSTNAESSLNAWLQAALQAFALPQWLPALPTVVFSPPQSPAAMPCFSFIHIPVDAAAEWQGRWAGTSKGRRYRGVLDVSCWVSRSASPDWLMQLRTMRDMVLATATADAVLVMSDYTALPTNSAAPAIDPDAFIGLDVAGDDGTWDDTPVSTAYKINIGDVALTATEADANPDVERARVLIDYWYVFRSG